MVNVYPLESPEPASAPAMMGISSHLAAGVPEGGARKGTPFVAVGGMGVRVSVAVGSRVNVAVGVSVGTGVEVAVGVAVGFGASALQAVKEIRQSERTRAFLQVFIVFSSSSI
jgi:hypothetical protein